MTRRTWVIAAAGALLLVLGGLAFHHYFEWREREVTLPPRGEARYNELFALGKALRIQGFEVATRATLNLDAMALAPGEVLVLATDVRSIGADDAAGLLDWVKQGGHLVFSLPDAETGRAVPLTQELGLELTSQYGCVRWKADGATGPASLCHRTLIDARDDDEWTWAWNTDDGGYVAVRAQHGDGSWLALPNFGMLSGRALKRRNRTALTWALLQPMLGDGRVHLVYAVDLPPLYVLLVQRGWPVWIPALLALLAWLWRRSQRLGPILPLPAPDRRALLEHIRAAGEFAFRRRRGPALHAALKRRFDARLARDFPLLAALEGEDQVRAIAAAWRLDPIFVRGALLPSDLIHPEPFAASIRSLSKLQAPP